MGKAPDGTVTDALAPRHGGSPLPGAEVAVIDGPDRGARLELAPGVNRVGTAAGARLRLTDPTVSRLHCELHLTPGAVRIVDGGSTNGTYVDGVRVYDAEVGDGAGLRLGATALRLQVGGPEVPAPPASSAERFGDLLGRSPEMRRLYALLERAARTDVTVLVQGETGTGKELVARAIHDASPRAAGPFVAVDCGALSETLLESELFGHVKGAFTGAVADRRGVFEAAAGGTLFLDEIGELPLGSQRKLLRALEAREVRRVGSSVAAPVDVRVVAATNRHLARAVNEGAFREDLYYRLAVVEAHLPPLRARREDIAPLARHFADRFAGAPAPLPPAFVTSLLRRGWPGNVRELRNFIERAVSLGALEAPAPAPPRAAPPAAAEPVRVEALVPLDLPLKAARAAWLGQFDELYARALLAKTGGNVTRAAESAGVNRRFLQRLIGRLGLREGKAPGGER
jgi:transcriptional regulator with PAS, ATPase and Fis domain